MASHDQSRNNRVDEDGTVTCTRPRWEAFMKRLRGEPLTPQQVGAADFVADLLANAGVVRSIKIVD